MTDPQTIASKLTDLAGRFITEDYAVLRDARLSGPECERWPRISPKEARAISDDLHRANELAELVREFLRTHLEKESKK